MWGTVGSGLTPGSPPDGRTPEIPDPDPENPEKPEIPEKFMLHIKLKLSASWLTWAQ